MAMPLVGRFFRTMGVLPAAEDSIATALAAGRDVALWPGGEVDSLRPWTKREPADPPYLVPLSFDWDGEALLVATPTDSPTGRNLAATRTVRLGLGHTRDVSMIEGEVEVLEIDALPCRTAS